MAHNNRFFLICAATLFPFWLFPFFCLAQLNFNTSLNASQLAQQLAGPGVIVSNATLNCPQGAFGSFSNGATTNIGIGSGIILTSGDVTVAQGPDNSEGAGIDNFAAGDPDLDALAGAATYDACALEFDIVPLCDTISFQYVFGSEEYLEFVNAGYNDAFAFFISGPGFGAPTNIAEVPGAPGIPVSIDNVNDISYSQYYVNNDFGTSIQYDGFTTVIDATAIVQPCETYHLKLVIADAGDGILDSGVFLEQNSLQCGFVTSVEALENSIESCGDSGLFTFCRPTADATPLTINYTIAGTSINGTDYQTIPASVTIPAGQTCTTLVVVPIQDAITEGDETIRIIYQPGPCPVMDTTIMLINEDAEIDPGPGATFCSGDSALIGPSPQGGWIYSWSPTTGLSNPNSAQTWVSLFNSGSTNITQTYTLTANMGICNATGTVTVTVTPGPDANFTAATPVCLGQSIQFNNTSVPFQTCIGLCPGPPPFCICTDNLTTYFWDFGNGNTSTIEDPSYTYPSAGTYTVTLTMTDVTTGCSGMATQTVVVQNSGTLTLTVSPDVTVCAGQSYTITVTGASTYNWSSNPPGFTSTSSTIVVTPSVTTTYLVSGNSGCGSGTEDVIVTVGSSFTVNYSVTNIICNGDTNGSITLGAAGGTPPFTYQWSPSVSIGPSAAGLGDGNYSITVTDNTSCSYVTTVTLTEPAALVISGTPSGVSCYGYSTGAVNIAVSGGTVSYSYLWSNTQTVEDLTAVIAGNYTVTVTDGNNCQATAAFTVTEPAPFTLSFSAIQPDCGASNGSITVTVTGGVSPYTYTWSPAGPNNNTYPNIPAGIYSVTVTDANSCAITDTFNLTSTGNFQALISAFSNVSCYGESDGSATVTATGAPPYTYLWLPSAQDSVTATGLPAGIHSAFVVDAYACTTSVSVTITEPSPVIIAAVPANTLCAGSSDGTLDISVSGGTPGYTYIWSDASTAEDLVEGAGEYTVTVTDSKGCTQTFTDTINSPPPIVPVTSSTPATCGMADGSVSVITTGGTGTYSYLWVPGNATLQTVTGLAAGVYLVTVTDGNGCTGTSVAVITNPGAPVLNISAQTDVTCYGSADGTATVSASGGNPPFTIVWNTNPSQTNSTATGLSPGTWAVSVTDLAGCIAATTVQINEPESITVSVYGTDTICAGASATIGASATGGTPPYTFIWDQSLPQGPVQTVTPSTTTTYTVIVMDGNNCTGQSQSATVSLNGPLSVNITGITSVCEGDATTLMATGSGGDGGPYTYLWSNNSTDNPVTVAPTATTTYFVTVSDNCNTPPATASITIIVQPQLLLSPPSAQGCGGETYTLSASGAITYWWSESSAPAETLGVGSQITVSPTVTTWYIVHGFDGVCEGVDTVAVVIVPPPVADFTLNPDTTTLLYPTILFSDASTQDVTQWLWDFGDGISDIQQNTSHTYSDTGTYYITLSVINSAGCPDEITKPLRINPEFILFMPNSFTPTGDGVNEYLLPKYIGLNDKNYRFSVFDRWGDLIWETTDPQKPWDGTANNSKKIVQQDVYVWIIETRDFLGKYHTFIGHVTVVK
ncbi:MAG: choice-of-anchor L domain-containing protein [Bacteroidetes bacterium]|nr:choice-of-anchor L domain-containing protein [Bacteroidota bacterium]